MEAAARRLLDDGATIEEDGLNAFIPPTAGQFISRFWPDSRKATRPSSSAIMAAMAVEANVRRIGVSCLMGLLMTAGCKDPVHGMNPNKGDAGVIGDASLIGDVSLPAPKGVFVPAGRLSVPRAYHTATLLPNGKVLIAGGANLADEVMSAELYDATAGGFSTTGNLNVARMDHTATLLGSGKVLIVGGEVLKDGVVLASAELYDPATGRFSRTGSLAIPRATHTASLLANGKVLVTGGFTDDKHEESDQSASLSSAELYDPETGIFSTIGKMTMPRAEHAAVVLSDGRVLIAGGVYAGGVYLASAELYDPTTGTFAATGSMSEPRVAHTALLLNNALVLVVCGHTASSRIAMAELYDPGAGRFRAIGAVVEAKQLSSATLLGDGKVLIVGGTIYSPVYSADAEVYDPAAGTAGTFTATGKLAKERAGHSATLLGNGTVLIAGGSDGHTYIASAEVYQ